MNRREKLSMLAIGFIGGWVVRCFYEPPGWWRNWHTFEFPVLLLLALLIFYGSERKQSPPSRS